jgi:hypothetical protein
MFDFLRNLGRSDADKQQEALSAYLDNELAPADRQRLEQQMASDRRLQEEFAQMQAWQQEMRSLPRRRVPRNFTLDPALYGRPQPQPLGRAYPVLRTATAFTAILLVIALAANVFLGQSTSPQDMGIMTAPEAAMPLAENAVEEAPLAAIVQDEAEIAVEEPQAEIEVEEETEVAVEEAAEAEDIVQEGTELAAEAPAESFLLEQSAIEMEAAEAPSDFAPETELMPQGTPSLSPALEIVEATALPPAAGGGLEADGEFSEPPQEVIPPPEPEVAEEAPQPRSAPESIEATAVATELQPRAPSSQPSIFNSLVIFLAILFFIFAALTILARSRR